MNSYPPYYCDVLASDALRIKNEIKKLQSDVESYNSMSKRIIEVLIPDLENKHAHLMDVLHKEGLPLQAL